MRDEGRQAVEKSGRGPTAVRRLPTARRPGLENVAG